MHDGRRTPQPCSGQQGVIIQRQQAAGGIDAISERGQIGEVGELLRQKLRLNVGIGIAIGNSGPQFFLKIGDDQRLAGREGLPAPQRPVVPPELADRGPIVGGDGGKGFSLLDGMHLPGKANDQRLPNS